MARRVGRQARRESERHEADAQVQENGEPGRARHAEKRQNDVPGRPRSERRTERVRAVEQADRPPELGARRELFREHGHRDPHQRGGRQEHERAEPRLEHDQDRPTWIDARSQRDVHLLKGREEPRRGGAIERDGHFAHRIDPEGVASALPHFAADPRAERDAPHVGCEHRGRRRSRVTEREGEGFGEDDFVDEPGETGDEEHGRDAELGSSERKIRNGFRAVCRWRGNIE